jgi:hypothetical protein
MRKTSATSEKAEKYFFRVSVEVCQDRPPIKIFPKMKGKIYNAIKDFVR